MAINFTATPFSLDSEAIRWVEDTLRDMSTEEKVGQLFCVLFRFAEVDEFHQVFSVLKPGGCMYRCVPLEKAVSFSNLLNREADIPMLIAANLEKGGNGIIEEGTQVGSPMQIAATGDAGMSEKLGIVCAAEGKAAGANWAFTPIIDIDTNFRNPITNTRTFGSNPELVKDMGVSYVKAIQRRGMAATVKHFPGDGQDERDQHLVTSINDMDCETWDNTYGQVYQACIDAGVMACMTGHIMLPEYSRRLNPGIRDEDIMPASLDAGLLSGLLRGQLGFNGLIVTDATTMAGFTLPMSRKKAVPFSIACGCDMFLFSRNLEEDVNFMFEGVKSGIITEERLDEAVMRILATKAALELHTQRQRGKTGRQSQQAYIDIGYAKSTVGKSEHKSWAMECADKSITLVKEQQGVLPITPEKYRRILFHTIEAVGGVSLYTVVEACSAVMQKLRDEGFIVDLFEPSAGMEGEGNLPKTVETTKVYDLILYVANLATKSNQTVVRIEWAQPMGANCGHYINDVPTIFISLENPYHLLDFPRVKTMINCYSSSDVTINALIDKLCGRSAFKGESPVDPFCGKWDARL